MSLKKAMDCERKQLEKYQNLSLPNHFKRIGMAISIIAFLTLVGFKFIENEPYILRDIVKKAIIVGLLLFALSKDKIEDELTLRLRGQAFTMAFILGVVYSIVQPFITYLIATIIGKEDKNDLLELGDFQLMFFMLVVQIGFYWMLKKYR